MIGHFTLVGPRGPLAIRRPGNLILERKLRVYAQKFEEANSSEELADLADRVRNPQHLVAAIVV